MKRLILIIITIAVLYFILGFSAEKLGFLNKEFYNESATIIGGIASILGLLGIVLPGIKPSDIKDLEISNLLKLAQTAEEIKARESELSTKQRSIAELEIQRKEMEFLIRKASLSLYLKDQLENYNNKLLELYDENKELRTVVDKISDIKIQIDELDVEIENSDMAEKVYDTIKTLRRPRSGEIELSISLVNFLGKFFKAFFSVLSK